MSGIKMVSNLELGRRLSRWNRKLRNRPVVQLRYLVMWAWRRIGFRIPLPLRMASGFWWFANPDANGTAIFSGTYEENERVFMERVLRPAMVMLDVGAHHGFYTLLASKKVGPVGRVIAFEPSLRESRRLKQHVWLNRCHNIIIEEVAMTDRDGEDNLFVADWWNAGLNSLRPPHVDGPLHQTRVRTTSLDQYVENCGLQRVDFVKLDVEGAELAVLKGGVRLFTRKPQPLVMCEMQDGRTEPWGYRAVEIYEFLAELGYSWFSIAPGGALHQRPKTETYDENLVALPSEWL